MKVRSLRKQAKFRQGPGTPAYRFKYIMNELDARFPNPEPFSSSFMYERYAIQRVDLLIQDKADRRDEIRILHKAMHKTIQALNDWTATYASEHCSEEMVESACKRIMEYGTIGYIAHTLKIAHDALVGKEDEND